MFSVDQTLIDSFGNKARALKDMQDGFENGQTMYSLAIEKGKNIFIDAVDQESVRKKELGKSKETFREKEVLLAGIEGKIQEVTMLLSNFNEARDKIRFAINIQRKILLGLDNDYGSGNSGGGFSAMNQNTSSIPTTNVVVDDFKRKLDSDSVQEGSGIHQDPKRSKLNQTTDDVPTGSEKHRISSHDAVQHAQSVNQYNLTTVEPSELDIYLTPPRDILSESPTSETQPINGNINDPLSNLMQQIEYDAEKFLNEPPKKSKSIEPVHANSYEVTLNRNDDNEIPNSVLASFIDWIDQPTSDESEASPIYNEIVNDSVSSLADLITATDGNAQQPLENGGNVPGQPASQSTCYSGTIQNSFVQSDEYLFRYDSEVPDMLFAPDSPVHYESEQQIRGELLKAAETIKRKEKVSSKPKSEPSLKCPMCPKRFVREKNLQNHMEMHSKENQIACGKCGVTFADKSLLLDHISVMHKCEKLFECNVCGYWAENPQDIEKHYLLTHANDKAFKCNICSKVFDRKGSLKKHVKTSLKCRELI